MRARRAVLAGWLAGAVLLGASCSAADDPEPEVADLDFEPVATLVVDETGFDVDQLQIETGESITLVNDGDEPHSFVSADPLRDTGALLPGDEVLLRFDEADEVEAHDGSDPEQTVTITIVEAPAPSD